MCIHAPDEPFPTSPPCTITASGPALELCLPIFHPSRPLRGPALPTLPFVTICHPVRPRSMFAAADVEVLRPNLPRGKFRSVLFDFDGTLSLIRAGWPEVMIPMMVLVLRETGTAESEAELTAAVEDFVMRLNGRQTIYQMIQLAEEVRRRGGSPLDPLAYKHRYHDLLMERIRDRLAALESGAASPEEWTVP